MSLALITGASSGIGREFAKRLLKEGVNEFWLIARSTDKMENLAEELGCKCKIITADLSKAEGISAVKCALEAERPIISFFVNSAGFGDFGSVLELTDEEQRRLVDLNVTATLLLTRAAIPFMERGGRIIELGSASAFTPLPYFSVYAASKAFVLHYTRALNYEIKDRGIKATCFCPGWVATDFIGKAQKPTGRTMPKKIFPILNCERVVDGCVRAAKKGRAVYATGAYTKLQRALARLLPIAFSIKVWLLSFERKQKNGKKKS